MTLNLFRYFMPREVSFTALFCEQTKCIVAASQELRRMINTGGSNDIHVTTIRSLELEADEVAKKVFIAANRTFTHRSTVKIFSPWPMISMMTLI